MRLEFTEPVKPAADRSLGDLVVAGPAGREALAVPSTYQRVHLAQDRLVKSLVCFIHEFSLPLTS